MLCNGLGFYDLDVPPGHPDFSKTFRCPNNPPEQDEGLKERLYRISNLGAFSEKRFENFNTQHNALRPDERTSLQFAARAAESYAHEPFGWAMIYGPYGCGKTHLAAAIANHRLEMGDPVLFITVPDLLDHLRSTFGPSSEIKYDEMFERIRSVQLLVLDDLGSENPSPWAKEKLFQIIDHRHSAELPTVITTNIEPDFLDARIRSRITDTRLVKKIIIRSRDFRNAMEKEKEIIQSNLHLYHGLTFESFNVESTNRTDERQNLQRAFVAARDYSRNTAGWFVLMGNSGVGKSHLAAAIANHKLQEGRQVMMFSITELLDYLRQSFQYDGSANYNYRLDQLKHADMLVVDDLNDMKYSKNWATEKLLQILKYRYLTNAPTVLCTNQNLEGMDEQLRTRLKDGDRVTVFGITARPYVDRK